MIAKILTRTKEYMKPVGMLTAYKMNQVLS